MEFYDATTTEGARTALAHVVADLAPRLEDYEQMVHDAGHALADAIRGLAPFASLGTRSCAGSDPRAAHSHMMSLVIERWSSRGITPGRMLAMEVCVRV